MVIQTKELDIPEGQTISTKFLERVKKIYENEKRNIRSKELKDRLGLEIKLISNEDSREYNSFEEFFSEVLPERINSIEISFSNYHSSTKFISFSLRIDTKYSFLSKLIIRGKNEEIINRVRDKVKDIFKDFKTNYSWIYSLKEFPIYSLSTIFSVTFILLIFRIFEAPIKSGGTFYVFFTSILVPFIVFFIFLSYKIMIWLFPKINFDLREKISDSRKIIKYILGVIALTLIGNTIWMIVKWLI